MNAPMNEEITGIVGEIDRDNKLVEIAGQWYWAKLGLFAQIQEHFPSGQWVKAEIGPEYEVVALVALDRTDTPGKVTLTKKKENKG